MKSTQAIDASGNVVAPKSNLSETNELRATARDLTAEARAKGHFNTASTFIEDGVANNNPNVVRRDGSRQHVTGGYRPTDLIMIDGMEIQYEIAQSLGMVQGGSTSAQQNDFVPLQVSFQPNAEAAEVPVEGPLEGPALLSAQIDLATDGQSESVLESFTNDVVELDDISEENMAFAAEKLGMNEKHVIEQYNDLVDIGGQNVLSALETGDGLGSDRVAFLVDLYENGTLAEQKQVRQLWAGAALGKLNKVDLQRRFDQIVSPYEA
ncbi:hypothetical protein [Actibacterium pelagium]|uniref:Uncharacterized protein n=1 Tax=Actibacterium pelagium TaxID=2029103 RepID=A0A917AFD1_9RHOB|nr:hypothetical protein [Actibacterium pelagium]GGE46815.1 hypothetical protein GCM10011517_13200 [Actibacterium pelagium]